MLTAMFFAGKTPVASCHVLAAGLSVGGWHSGQETVTVLLGLTPLGSWLCLFALALAAYLSVTVDPKSFGCWLKAD